MTLLQPEPSANAPWTRTMAGLESDCGAFRVVGSEANAPAIAARAKTRVAAKRMRFMVRSFRVLIETVSVAASRPLSTHEAIIPPRYYPYRSDSTGKAFRLTNLPR